MLLVLANRTEQQMTRTLVLQTEEGQFFLVAVVGAGEVAHIINEWLH